MIVTLLNLLGRPDQAYRRLMQRNFHPWEGGEGKVAGQYVTSLVELARQRLGTSQVGYINLLELGEMRERDGLCVYRWAGGELLLGLTLLILARFSRKS